MSDNIELVVLAHCGLVCSQCGMYLKGRCRGCHSERPMHSRCKVKRCCLDRQYATCAQCDDFANLKQCGKLHNLISIVFGFIFRSNRIGNLGRIREIGVEKFADEAATRSQRKA